MPFPVYEHLKVDQEVGVLRLRLNRPRVYNALNGTTIAELGDCLGRITAGSDMRVLVLSGEGPAFCSGVDLEWMRKAANFTMDENLEDANHLAEMLSLLNDCPIPTVARAHGAIFGGGVGLLAACDTVVAADDARFSLSEVKLGLLPAVISPLVVAKIGESHARALFASGRRFDAERALRIGLVHQVVGTAELDDAVREVIRDHLSAAPGAAAEARALINLVKGKTPLAARAETTRIIARLRSEPEGREGVAAFLEKRKPAWIEGDA
ncbi:MAG: enoyl-CoA hydratase-related protein [Chloroflexota bacterium]